jgi:hypothetical protein
MKFQLDLYFVVLEVSPFTHEWGTNKIKPSEVHDERN